MSQTYLTGAYATDVPVVSQNTAALLKFKAKYYNGTGSISIPLVKGTRHIITALFTDGNTISIGFGQAAGTITDSRFTFTATSGPIDFANFFNAAPFSQYKEPNASFVYLIITGEGGKQITAAIATMKA
jgi:hypothetical protein